MVARDYYVLFKRLGFAFLFYVVSRVLFYFYNFKYFSVAQFWETIQAFFVGLRFDIATTLIANLFFIIFSLVPTRGPRYHLFLKVLFVLFNTIFLGLIIVDFEFFAFNGKKLTLDIFFNTGDVQAQFFQVIFYYWYLSLLTIATSGILWRYYPRRKKEYLFEFPMKLYKAIPASLVIFIFVAIGIRGGLQLRSISAKEAFVFDTYELGNFSINSAYTFARSLSQKRIQRASYYKNKKLVKEELLKQRSFNQGLQLKFDKKQNIIIIILESFSAEYIEQGYAPFLSRLAKEGLSFDFGVSNGRRSIEALPSILAGLPSIIGKPYYQSNYQANKLLGLPDYIKDLGYKSHFFHGGKTGTMGFDAFCKSIGFDEYYGMEDYPESDHFDEHWGIYDHYFFDYMLSHIEKYEEPFLNVFFSLSSHQPYKIPKNLEKEFKVGTLPIHKSIGYADYALEQFFSKAQKQDWFKDTLFIITADHTQKLGSKKYQTILGRYRVPLIFYHPNQKFEKKKILAQQVDILPSVLDFLNINPSEKLYFGSSVFNNDPGRMINYNSDSFLYGNLEHLLIYDGQNLKSYQVEADHVGLKKLNSDPTIELFREMKAIIQYAQNGLIKNNIYQD